jgi:citrate lyase subunit alpha/citrate CoA-transferase
MKRYTDLNKLMAALDIHDTINISFHHHLRNGDHVINRILPYFHKNNIKQIGLYPSAIFPSYTSIIDLLKNKQIDHIKTNYLNGPVADYLAKYGKESMLTMQTHGGRARAIIEKETIIDIAFIAASTVDKHGNASGAVGPSACGSLGYAIEDVTHAKTTVLITDNYTEDTLETYQIDGKDVDYVLVVDSIGDKAGIVSGTTAVTTNPIGVKIAKNASQFITSLNLIKQGFSFQSGAGGISLRVTESIKSYIKTNTIKASFFSGGITKYHVDMLEEGLVENLYDVQCFDLDAVRSIAKNPNHIAISANDYANPNNPNRIIKDLDIVILGCTEVDLDFNVNVTTDSYNTIIGGSGGHSDTATDAKLSLIVTPLIKARTPIIKTKVNTITTLGKHIDVIVTERGIAINPLRTDLIDALKDSPLDIVTIEALMARAHHYTGVPSKHNHKGTPIGIVEDRDGTIIDTLYKKV